jgi:hypothetical protein
MYEILTTTSFISYKFDSAVFSIASMIFLQAFQAWFGFQTIFQPIISHLNNVCSFHPRKTNECE